MANYAASQWVMPSERIAALSVSFLFWPLCVLTISPSSIHKATIHPAEKNEQTLGKKKTKRKEKKKRKKLRAGPIDKQSRSCDLFTAVCYVERREKKSLLIWPQAADIMGPSQSSVSGLLDCQAGFRRCSKALSDQTPEMRATRQMITHCKRSRRGKKRNNYSGYWWLNRLSDRRFHLCLDKVFCILGSIII